MTKNQIRYLKLLGYEDTQEDGALLQHKRFHAMGRYVWKDETFQEVLFRYQSRFDWAVKTEVTNKIFS